MGPDCAGLRNAGFGARRESEEWGKVIKFANKDKLVRKEIVTATMLHNDLKGVIGRLANLGMFITGKPDGRLAFAEYLLLEEETDKRATVASSTGWIEIGGQLVFVLPDEIIGAALDEQVILGQRRRRAICAPRDAGRAGATRSPSRLATISCRASPSRPRYPGRCCIWAASRAASLHLHGSSSFGKTTMLRMAASSWGSGADNGFVRSGGPPTTLLRRRWRPLTTRCCRWTSIGQADPRAVGRWSTWSPVRPAKRRMSRDATVKPSHQWRTLVLVVRGEADRRPARRGPSKRAHAGQLVRAIDIKVERKQGAFDQSADILDASAFANSETRRLDLLRGAAGPEFVRLLIDAKIDADDVRSRVDAFTEKALESVKDDRDRWSARRSGSELPRRRASSRSSLAYCRGPKVSRPRTPTFSSRRG